MKSMRASLRSRVGYNETAPTSMPALIAFFALPLAALRAALTRVPAGQFEVWVTHQVNITALTGEVPAMGEVVVVNAQGKMVARSLLR